MNSHRIIVVLAVFCVTLLLSVVILIGTLMFQKPEVKVTKLECPSCKSMGKDYESILSENFVLKSKLENLGDNYEECLAREVDKIVRIK